MCQMIHAWSYLFFQCDIFFVCSLIAEQYDVKVSVNDIIIKVVAAALRNVPEANGKYFYCITQSIFHCL